MPACIFCQIVRGESPCAKIYEDELVLSFLDINPINPGHALVIPKAHYATLFEIPEPELLACAAAARRIAPAVFRAANASGMNFYQNNYRAAGQLVDHFHFHLIPRRPGDGFLPSWPGKPTPAGELEKMLRKVQEELRAR
jgi:histidine triad (HIT) family protein